MKTARAPTAVRGPSPGARTSRRALLAPCLLALLAAAACAGPGEAVKTDPELAHAGKEAGIAFMAGQTDRAAGLYQRALQRARAMDDAEAVADSAYNLAACLLALGDTDRARTYLSEAQAAAERSGGKTAEVLLLKAECARASGSFAEAAGLCREVLALPEAEEDVRVPAQAFLFQCRLACDAGDAADARRQLAAADDLSAELDQPLLHARAEELRGRICEIEGAFAAAGAAFDREAALLREAERYSEMAGALVRSGQAHLDAGLSAEAADRFYRAAASFFGHGELALSKTAVEVAAAAATRAGAAEVLALVEALREEMAGRE